MATRLAITWIVWLALSANAFAQTSSVIGVVRDETGGTLPGVSVELKNSGSAARHQQNEPNPRRQSEAQMTNVMQLVKNECASRS